MKKVLEENILLICCAVLAAVVGFSLTIYVFTADTIRAEIVDAGPICAYTYEVEEPLSKDDPDYEPAYHTSKTTHATKYYRRITVEIDGKRMDMELASEFRFMLPGQGKKVTVSYNYDGSLFWEHPMRNLIMGEVLEFIGLGGLFLIVRPGLAKSKSKSRSSKKKRRK